MSGWSTDGRQYFKDSADATNFADYSIRSGREIYSSLTRTLLNRMPVTRHLPRVLGKTADPGKRWTLAEVATRLIVDGTLLAVDGELQDGLAAPPVHEPRATHVEQCLGWDASRREITRVYERAAGADGLATGPWWITDYANYDGRPLGDVEVAQADDLDNAEVEIDQPAPTYGREPTLGELKCEVVWGPTEYPEDYVYIFPNGLGLLFWTQHDLERIERIAETIEDQMSGASLALIILGYTGDWAQARREFTSGPRVVNIPTRGASVARVGSTAVIDHLLSEMDMLVPRYLDATYLIDTNKGANTSGEAWSIRLEGMRYYVQQVQGQLKQIFGDVFNVPLTFDNWQITSAQSRLTETQILDTARLSGAISPAEHAERLRGLLPG